MKKFIFILMALGCLFSSCGEEYIGQYPTDSEPPEPVSNIRVENGQGQVLVHYDLPDVSDIMGVKAKYVSPEDGQYKEMFSSAYVNSILLNGFGRGHKFDITLVAVDNSYNESTPVVVEVEPLDSPIYYILSTLQYKETFGGLVMTWENPLKVEVVVGVGYRDQEGKFKDIEAFYSNAANPTYTFHGMDAVPTEFGFYCRDYSRHSTDTLYQVLTPIYEEMLDKSKFVEFPVNTSKFSFHKFGGKSVKKMWDNIYDAKENCLYLNNKTAGKADPIYVAFDMTVKARFSRIRLWTRLNYEFQYYTTKVFQMYGTNDYAVASTDGSTEGWELLGTFESLRPSGNPEPASNDNPLSQEELQYALAGEEWFFPEDISAYRYVKYVLLSNWDGNRDAVFIEEMDLYGQIETE